MANTRQYSPILISANIDQPGWPILKTKTTLELDVGTDVITLDSCRRLRNSFAASNMPVGEGLIYDKDTWYW
jgi:hypothetical protein